MSFLTDYYTTVDNSIRLKVLGIVLLEAVIDVGLLVIVSLLIGPIKVLATIIKLMIYLSKCYQDLSK